MASPKHKVQTPQPKSSNQNQIRQTHITQATETLYAPQTTHYAHSKSHTRKVQNQAALIGNIYKPQLHPNLEHNAPRNTYYTTHKIPHQQTFNSKHTQSNKQDQPKPTNQTRKPHTPQPEKRQHPHSHTKHQHQED